MRLLALSIALMASLSLGCQPPTPSFQFSGTPSYTFSSHAHQSLPASPSYPVLAPAPPPPPPGLQSYSNGGGGQGLLASGVRSGEGVYQGSPPAAYSKLGKSKPRFEPYPGYVPPPMDENEERSFSLDPIPTEGATSLASGFKHQSAPLNMALLRGAQIPASAPVAPPPPPPPADPRYNAAPTYTQQTAYPQQQQLSLQPPPPAQFSVNQPPAYQAQQPAYGNGATGAYLNGAPQSGVVYQQAPLQPPPGTYPQQNVQYPIQQQQAASHSLQQQLAVSTTPCSSFSSISEFSRCVASRPPPASSPSALACSFEDGTSCRFDSQTLAVTTLQTAEQSASFARLTGRSEAPSGAFAFQVVEHPRGEEIVLATPISCQKGNGVLKLSYWLSDATEIDFKVCTQDHIARSCTQPIVYSGAPSVLIEVVHPNATVFDVEIVAANIVHPLLFAIDDVEYKAELCEDQKQPSSSSADGVESFFSEDGQSSSVRGTERREERREAVEEGGNESSRVLSARPSVLQEEVDASDYDSEVGLPEGITAFDHDVSLDDNSVPTATSSLRVIPDRGPKDPFRGISMKRGSEETSFPPAVAPFRDDPISIKPRRLNVRRVSTCQLLDCAFDGNTCHYSNYQNETGRYGLWNLGNKKNSNAGVKGVKDGAGFLYVGTDSSRQDNSRGGEQREYILESPPFILSEDTPLSFDVYRRSNDISLQVCFDTLDHCPYAIPALEKDVYWKEGETVMLPRGARKVFFVATQKKRFKWLAIDNIRLRSRHC